MPKSSELEQADGICVSPAQLTGHETLAEIYPEDYPDGNILFNEEDYGPEIV